MNLVLQSAQLFTTWSLESRLAVRWPKASITPHGWCSQLPDTLCRAILRWKLQVLQVIVILRSKQYRSVTSGSKEQITTLQPTSSSSSEPPALWHHPSPWAVLDTPQPDLSQEQSPRPALPVTMSASVFRLEVDNTELRARCSTHQKQVLSCIFLNCSDTITWQFNQTDTL